MHFANDADKIRRTQKHTKSELMLMRRATAYSSFCSQVVLVGLYLLRPNSVLKCSPEPKKITKNSYFKGSKSFKIISVNIS